jgi:hypothetical protein
MKCIGVLLKGIYEKEHAILQSWNFPYDSVQCEHSVDGLMSDRPSVTKKLESFCVPAGCVAGSRRVVGFVAKKL